MASKAPKPTVRERLANRICPNCGKSASEWGPAPKRGPGRTFCTKTCKVAHNNRHLVEGRAAIGFLKAWRIDRGQGPIAQASFAQLCEIADQFNAADLAANRPRADYYAATILVDGTRFFDRQRGPRSNQTDRVEQPEAVEETKPDLAAILRQIAEGHNDSRALAAEALANLV